MNAPIRAVIFDMDGTITRPWFDFRKIRDEIGVPEPVLENMQKMPPGPERDRAFEILERYERKGVEESQLNDGAREAVAFLKERGIPTGLVTRNSRRSTEGVLAKHGMRFDVVVAREDAPIKPSPEPLLLICRRLGVPPAETLMVGDYKYDITAGREAGTRTCLITNALIPPFPVEADHVIERLDELRNIPGLVQSTKR